MTVEGIADILQEIIRTRRARVAEAMRNLPQTELRQRAVQQPSTESLSASLRRATPPRAAVIAEFKRRSPSRGRIGPDRRLEDVIADYERGGARAISVLTEPDYFAGDDIFLRRASQQSDLPILRKDFIISPYQIYESRCLGADAILLIAALFGREELTDMLLRADQVGLEALVEVHTYAELDRSVAAGARLIGINNRALHTFRTDLRVTEELAGRVPSGILTVSESGIRGRTDVDRLARAGADAFLVGESLMCSTDPAMAVRDLVHGPVAAEPQVKICGLKSRAAVRAAVLAGATHLGFVFADSRRAVSAERARQLINYGRSLSGRFLAVGVFADSSESQVREIAEAADLDAVQMHGGETPAVCRRVRAFAGQVYRAVRVGQDDDEDMHRQVAAYEEAGVDAFILDTYVPGIPGGTGRTFDWRRARTLRSATDRPIFIAGGLTPDNVGCALAASRADGVDVSGGVEREADKAPDLIRRFAAAARKQ